MASLRNIMNVDVDDDHAKSSSLKNPPDATSRASDHPDMSTTPGTHTRASDYTTTASPSRDQRFVSSSRSSRSLPVDQRPAGPSYSHSAHSRPHDRRQSNTSTDSMDSHYGHGHGYGQTQSASFSNPPMRPFVPPPEAAPLKLTPITGRVSRAKKGVPVHTCDICRPPKTFTRAEHLRRHQLSHQPPDLACPFPGCEKVFHRRDLLDRHQQRHDSEDRVGKSSSDPTSRSPYNTTGGSRNPSYTSSPPGSLIPIQQYGSASPSPAAPPVSVGSGHWPTHKNPLPMQHASNEILMEEIKSEYLVDSTPVSLRPSSTDIRAGYAQQPRSMPAVTAIDPVQTICPPVATVPASSWTTAPVMPSSEAQACFSSAAVSPDRRQSASLCSADWAPVTTAGSRVMTDAVLTTSGSFAVSFGYGAPVPSTSYESIYEHGPAVGISTYDDSPSLYGAHIPTPALRSLSPQILVGQSSETMVAVAAPLPADRVINTMSYRGEPSPGLSLLSQELMPLNGEARSALPIYIAVFWRDVHPLYPIIHKPTAEDGASILSEEVDMLRCAMAAVATQFLPHIEHRINGNQLHAFACQKSRAFTQDATWSLPVMQTVLLCEYYARFRGRHKDDYQPSPQFVALYQLVSGCRLTTMPEVSGDNAERWAAWIHMESCRRLLSACFLLSVHGMCYHEQPYSAVLGPEEGATTRFDIPLSAPTSALWNARNAEAWAAIDTSSLRLTCVADVIEDASWPTEQNPDFDVSLVIAAHALQLPTRQNRQEVVLIDDVSHICTDDMLMDKHFSRWPGAAVYLALHHTPLHVLLAVSGESWLFNKKLPDASLFSEYKSKLGQWQKSGTSALATVFAARAIRDFLSLSDDDGKETAGRVPPSPHSVGACKDISDYWGLYVCTLICWAFGHVGKKSTAEKRLPPRNRAVSWILKVADSKASQIIDMPEREFSQSVVGFVREILEKDCLGGRSVLFADSVGVLRRLEDVDSWSWF